MSCLRDTAKVSDLGFEPSFVSFSPFFFLNKVHTLVYFFFFVSTHTKWSFWAKDQICAAIAT